jgi:hypothetical protein
MTELSVLSVFGEDLPDDKAWHLLEWCHSRGADEFTLFGIVCEGSSDAPLREFDRLAKPFRRSRASRRHLSGPAGKGLIYETDLFELNSETISALRVAFPQGIFDYYPASSAWFEDLEVFRAEEMMLGVITHEHEGVLRVSPEERALLDKAGIAYRLKGEWVGY